MFTWICPQCGREVPPSYNDCPDCAAKGKAPPASPAAQPPVPQPPPPPQYQAAPPAYQPPPQQPQYQPPQYQPPPQQPPPQQPQYQQPQYQPPPPARAGLPTWLMSVVFALAFGGVVLGAYFAVEYFKKEPSAAAHSDGVEPAAPRVPSSAADAKGSPLRKQIEVVGLRLTQNKAKKTEVRFLVVNHSGAEIQDLAVNANLQARTKKEEEPVGTFSFKVPSLAPYESKEMSAVVNTKLKVYELPDWQNLDLRLQFTSP